MGKNKKDILIIILGTIIVLLILLIGYLIINKKNLSNKNNKTNTSSSTTTTITIYAKKLNYTSLDNYLKSLNINAYYLNISPKFKCNYNNSNSCITNSNFINNNEIIYIDANKEILSFNKIDNLNNGKKIEVFMYNNYYILFSYISTGGGHFKIFNNNLKEVFKDEYEEEFLVSKNIIYYSVYDCYYGNRLDGSYGAMKGSKKLDLTTMKVEFYTYLNHDAGWKC